MSEGILDGKLALVAGVANKRSIAWAIAQALHGAGARLAFTYQGERLEDTVRKLAGSVDSDVVVACDVTDDGSIDALTSDPDDATEDELRDVIAGLNDDERADLIAMVYIGRGDMEPEEWGAAVRLAREREAASSLSTADWLIGIPNLADLLDEGLNAMGRSCA